MIIFILTLAILLVVVIAMSIGVILQNKPIKGSCGGMSALGIDTECDICGGDMRKCEDEQQSLKHGDSSRGEKETTLAHDASKTNRS